MHLTQVLERPARLLLGAVLLRGGQDQADTCKGNGTTAPWPPEWPQWVLGVEDGPWQAVAPCPWIWLQRPCCWAAQLGLSPWPAPPACSAPGRPWADGGGCWLPSSVGRALRAAAAGLRDPHLGSVTLLFCPRGKPGVGSSPHLPDARALPLQTGVHLWWRSALREASLSACAYCSPGLQELSHWTARAVGTGRWRTTASFRDRRVLSVGCAGRSRGVPYFQGSSSVWGVTSGRAPRAKCFPGETQGRSLLTGQQWCLRGSPVAA